jgi:DNA-binding NarL/FixJ family response regulator
MHEKGDMPVIRVLLVEDQRLFREGVNALISAEDDIEVVGMVQHGKEAIQHIEKQLPDVVLMDVHMPEVDGIKATIHIKENYPTVKVILLTTRPDEDLITSGLSAGAQGFLLKNLDTTRLIRSIRDVYEDQVVLSGEAARILANKLRKYKNDKKALLGKSLEHQDIYLSKRELDVAFLLMENETNKHMAEELFLSAGTVKNYISELYNKVGIRSRKDVISYLRTLNDTNT